MIRRFFAAVAEKWNCFFFEPISPATIGLFRIGLGFVVFLSVLGRYPCRALFYTDSGIVTYKTAAYYFPNALFYFLWSPNSDPALNYYFLAILLFTIFLIIGLWTRLSSIAVFLGMISLSNRNVFVENAGDDLLRINCLILMFSQAGSAYSVDKWLRVKRGLETSKLIPKSPWAQRVLQLQLAYLYCETVLLKLPGDGWKGGTALYYALNYLELRRFNFKYLFYYLWQIKLATWSVLVVEMAAWTLIWFRKLRYWIVATAFLLHVGINLTMQFPIFQYVMMASLINFLYPEDVERVIQLLVNKISKIKKGSRLGPLFR